MRVTVLMGMCYGVLGQGYGPDPKGTPADFMCGWRTLAYEYANKTRPDSAALVYDAMQMHQYCPGTPRPDESKLSPVFPPSFVPEAPSVLYVDCAKGSDKSPGTEDSPLRTIQAAVDLKPKRVVLRGGVCRVQEPVKITAENSGLVIQNYPTEEVWISGATELEGLKWEQVKGKSGYNLWVADISKYKLDDIAELRVDGRRAWQARFPNADPEKDIYPIGYLKSTKDQWMTPKILPSPNPAYVVNVTTPNRNFDSLFSHYGGGINGTCSIYTPPFSYFCQDHTFGKGCGGCFTYNIPGGLTTKTSLPSYPSLQKDASRATLSAWRVAHWANWKFAIDSYHAGNTTDIVFGKGGFQGSRGGPGSDYYINNVIEELDVIGEFYYDHVEAKLYISANTTDGTPPTGSIEAVTEHTLLTITGESQQAPVQNVSLRGIGFRDTKDTMLEPHGVPSGGDWSLERMGVVFVENAEGTEINSCKFYKLGGNAVMFSKYNRYSRVTLSEFVWLGASAVVLWGWTDEISDGGIHGVDGTSGDFPRYTEVDYNLFREIGIWEKQSSAFFSGKAAQSNVHHNVVFNLARAGFNFNDGFGGGDTVWENVLFNTCRESSDHGPINSWDRQAFLTTIRTGEPSMVMAWRQVTRNIVIANYGGSKEVDNDDGSLFWNVTNNFMAYGWVQKFKCGAIYSSGNVKAYISTGGKFDAGCLLGDSKVFYPNLWHDDVMVHGSSGNFIYRQCWGSSNGHDWDKSQVYNNTIYMEPNTAVQVTCGKENIELTKFQKGGKDPGTRVLSHIPSTETIFKWARATLGTF